MEGEHMQFRQATLADLETLTKLEKACFPQAEAASKERISARLQAFAPCFLLMLKDDEVVGMVNGMRCNERDLRDEMYENTALHSKDGRWQMIFSVCIDPKVQRRGLGHKLLQQYIDEVRQNTQCQGIVLTCKEHLLKFYASHGFVDEGVSNSEHGGVIWHQMRLCFES